MIVLKFGTKGPDVERWQSFLVGLTPYSDVVITGEFDDDTVHETKEFQALNMLEPDGIVGKRTLNAARFHGFLECDPFPIQRIIPLDYVERSKLFGSFRYKSTPVSGMKELITILDGWKDKNIKLVEIPQLEGILGAPKDCKIQINVHVEKQIIKTFIDWEQEGLLDKILSWDGSFVPRFIRGSLTTLSNHVYGTAFDINARWNSLGTLATSRTTKGSVLDLVDIAQENGLCWGGFFKNRPDMMHFEVARIIV